MAYIKGGASGLLANVDDGNLQVILPQGADTAGDVRMRDSIGNEIITTENGALLTSQAHMLFYDQVDGSAVDLRKWNPSAVSNMTITQTGGFIILNAGAATTANAYAILQSVQYIPFFAELPTRCSFNVMVPVQPQSNVTMELGVGSVGTNAAPTDGAFFRWNPASTFQAVINNGGAETTAVITPAPSSNACHLLDIVIVEDLVQFYHDDVIVAEIPVPVGQAYPTNSGRLPIFFRVYNGSGVPGQAPKISIGQVCVKQEGMEMGRTWMGTMATMGQSGFQSPVAPFAQTSNFTNSAAPSTSALSNTVPCETTAGGLLRFTPTYVADTDYVLFAYQVPVGYQMRITDIWYTSPRLFSGTGSITSSSLQFAVGVNASAASLATADGAGTWAPRKISLGHSQLAAVPTTLIAPSDAGTNNYHFDPPLCIESGRFFTFILRSLIARTAGASEVQHMSVGMNYING